MWIVVIIAVAMYFAAKAGIPAAGRAIGEAWHNRGKNGQLWAEKRGARKQLTSDAVNSGMAPVSTKAGSTAGIATGAVITGGRLAFAAFLQSWRAGWREGVDRAEARRNLQTAGEPQDGYRVLNDAVHRRAGFCLWLVEDKTGRTNFCPQKVAVGERFCVAHAVAYLDEFGHAPPEYDKCSWTVGADSGDDEFCNAPADEDGLLCPKHAAMAKAGPVDEQKEETADIPAPADDPVLRGGGCSCPDHAIACPNPAVAGSTWCANCKPAAPEGNTTTRGARPMPVESAVSGEIVTYDQFIASLDASLVEARSDREEAAIKVKTTEANLGITDQQVAALTKLDLPKEVVDAVKATRDSRAAKVRAAQEELKASELEITQLTIALNAATNNPQQQFYRS